MRARVRPLLASPERMRSIGRAALDALLSDPRVDASPVAAIGYCAGKTIVLELGRVPRTSRPSTPSTPPSGVRNPATPATSSIS